MDSEPVDLGHDYFGLATAGLDLDLAPARVDLVDMYTRVFATLIGFFIERVELVVQNLALRFQRLALQGHGLTGVQSIFHLLLCSMLQLL